MRHKLGGSRGIEILQAAGCINGRLAADLNILLNEREFHELVHGKFVHTLAGGVDQRCPRAVQDIKCRSLLAPGTEDIAAPVDGNDRSHRQIDIHQRRAIQRIVQHRIEVVAILDGHNFRFLFGNDA